MEIKTIISKQPMCKTCGKLMLEWNAFADKCIAERISTNLIDIIKKQFETIN